MPRPACAPCPWSFILMRPVITAKRRLPSSIRLLCSEILNSLFAPTIRPLEKEIHTMSKRIHKSPCSLIIAIMFEALILVAPCAAQQWGNDTLSVNINAKDGTYQLAARGGQAIFTSRAAAQVNHDWLRSNDYPVHMVSESRFVDALGSG